MWDDVPDRLDGFLEFVVGRWDGIDRNMLYLEAAGGVIRQYIEKNVFDQNVDQFLGKQIVADSDNFHARYPLKVLRIGETLFLLRKCHGFNDLCRRFRQRDLRSTFYEASVARMFLMAGFAPAFRQEICEKGYDFDFVANKDEEIVNVEVTALTAQEFSSTTIMNALETKRRQLSKDNASVIVCVFPDEWRSNNDLDINIEIEQLVIKFLRNTGRVNVVVFSQDINIDIRDNGSIGMYYSIRKPIRNINPRFPTASLDFLFSDQPSAPVSAINAAQNPSQLLNNIESIAAIADETRISEFWRWVDSHVPPKA
jgi:hypothetical protein